MKIKEQVKEKTNTEKEHCSKTELTGRVMEIVTNLYTEEGERLLNENPNYPLTNRDYRITPSKIKNICEGKKSIKKFAWIIHDKDIYQEDSKEVKEGHVKAGDKKHVHVHIVLSFDTIPMKIKYVANWFGVAENFIEVKNGRNAFLDAVIYLTHEDKKQINAGKYLYPDNEVHSNFDFRKEIENYVNRQKAFGKNGGRLFEGMRTAVFRDGMTIDALRRWAVADDNVREIYTKNVSLFQKLRGEFLSTQPPSNELLNIYIEGKGGYGKGALSTMLARYLWKTFNPNANADEVREREMYYTVGDSRSGLQHYDGQQIVVWEDVRPGAIMCGW